MHRLKKIRYKGQLGLGKGLRKKTKGFEKRPFKILLKNQVDVCIYFKWMLILQ